MLNALKVSALFLATMGIAQADLIHSFNFENGLTDSAGASNGSLVGNAAVSGGQLVLTGGYVQFDSKIVPTSGSYSVSVDFQLASPTNPGYTEFISQGFSGGPGFYIGTAGLSFRATDSWGGIGGFDPSAAHTVLLSVDGTAGTSSFYLDGILVSSINAAITTTGSGTNTRFGTQFDPYAGQEPFYGTLDNIRIFNAAITPEQDIDNAQAPEPGTIFLAGLGVTAAALARRRRTTF